MALVLAGKVAPLATGDEKAVFAGRVWLGDDGRVAAVTRGTTPKPAGFDDAPVVDVGASVIYPGFVDLHSHIGFNTLPLWSDPEQEDAYLHHDSWPGGDSYKNLITWPAWSLIKAAPESLLTYVQVRAVAGGTTSIQGWPTLSRRATNMLVRSVDNDAIGAVKDPVSVSALTLELTDLVKRAQLLEEGRAFVYHCGEGQPGSIAAREFDDLAKADCLQRGTIAIHCTALEAAAFAKWKKKPGTVVWSPFSNLWLYGVTTDVPAARANKLSVCLGTDWGPSGTKNLLGELKVARLWSDAQGWGLTDHDLVRMITTNPGDALGRAWKAKLGRLVKGGLGDVVVLARRKQDPWANVMAAREADVRMVVVGGRPVYGDKALLEKAGVSKTTSVPVGSVTKRVPLVLPDGSGKTWPWSDVVARLDQVRKEAAVKPPAGPAGAARGAAARPAIVADPPGTPPLVARLDMPGAPMEVAGPPPKGVTVDIPPIEPLHHNAAWLATIRNRGFHGGALDGLRALFS